MDWLTVAMTRSFISSAMMVNGFCFSASASARTMIGGLMVMTCASDGRVNFGCCGAAGFGRLLVLHRTAIPAALKLLTTIIALLGLARTTAWLRLAGAGAWLGTLLRAPTVAAAITFPLPRHAQ